MQYKGVNSEHYGINISQCDYVAYWQLRNLVKVEISVWTSPFQVDEDFLAAYQLNYGFTPDGEKADNTTENIPETAADVIQTANNQVM